MFNVKFNVMFNASFHIIVNDGSFNIIDYNIYGILFFHYETTRKNSAFYETGHPKEQRFLQNQ